MQRYFHDSTRITRIILDPSLTKLRCRFGDIAVRVETDDVEKLEQLDLAIVGVRVGNLFILCDPDEPPLPLALCAHNERVSETIPVPEREVEVFYFGNDDPFLHGIEVRYKSVQICDVLFEVVKEETGCAEFMRCAFF